MINKLELIKLLRDNNAIMNLSNLSVEELTDMLGEDFAKQKDYSQNNPHHCHDLLQHTLHTVVGIDEFLPAEKSATLLKVAALFHDIGKPDVKKEKQGRFVFYGHAKKSVEITEPLLQQLDFEEAIPLILFYIEHHDEFISFKMDFEMPEKANKFIKEINEENVKQQIKSVVQSRKKNGKYIPSKTDFIDLLLLCMADASAQKKEVITEEGLIDGSELKIYRMRKIRTIIEDMDFDDIY